MNLDVAILVLVYQLVRNVTELLSVLMAVMKARNALNYVSYSTDTPE